VFETSNEEYQYWRHQASGKKYAVRLCAGRVIGCVGPVTWAGTQRHALGKYTSDDWPKAAAWAEVNRGGFLLLHSDSDEGWE
jgi:hypothetical protein